MKKTLLLLLSYCLLLTQQSHATAHVSANLLFAAKLTGDQETPPVNTSAYGVASCVLNITRDTLCINVTVRDLSSAITGAHIHNGTFGVAGPVVFDLTGNVSGNRITATLSGAMLTPQVIADFISRKYYINVHTVNNPGGEIRGQLELETDYAFKAYLTGAQVVPADSSPAIGVATIMLHHDYMYAQVKAQFTGLTGPITTAQLHFGAPGINGPEVASLDSFINGNTIVAEIPVSLFIYDMIAGNIYFNVNTAANPIGEVRGQILLQSDFAFDLWMNSAQETPPTASPSSGTGSVTFSAGMDTVYYDAVFDTLMTPPSSAHFHTGSMGVAGPVAVDLTTSLNGNHLSGMATALPADFVANCLLGNIYLNIHSIAYPTGEIRGQLKRYSYEGFTFSIDGMQETPPTPSSASGSGFVSIDREARSAHFRMVVNDLSGPISGAHFHEGTPGMPGPVMFDLTPYFSSTATSISASNYWTDINISTPFNSSYADMFMNNDMYVNFHTALYPGGEVRGNSIQGGECFLITSIADNITADGWMVYPNPAGNRATLNFTGYNSGTALIQICDVSGRKIISRDIHYSAGENKVPLDIVSLAEGIYILKIRMTNGYEFVTKLIKE